MTTLLDALNKGTTISPLGGSPGVGSTSQVAQLLQAKTGRDLSGGLGTGYGATPRMSTLGEAGAVAQSTAQLGQVQQQARTQQADIQAKSDAVAAEAGAQQAHIDSARLDSMQKRADQTAQLVQEYKQARGQLNADQERALAEQIGFSARLSSEQYVDALERAGAEARLTDRLSFQEATANAVFGQEAQLFADQFQANELLNMKQNQWNEFLGTVDLNQALALAGMKATAANQQAMWTGAGNATTAGIGAYATYAGRQPSTSQQTVYEDADFRGPTRAEGEGGQRGD